METLMEFVVFFEKGLKLSDQLEVLANATTKTRISFKLKGTNIRRLNTRSWLELDLKKNNWKNTFDKKLDFQTQRNAIGNLFNSEETENCGIGICDRTFTITPAGIFDPTKDPIRRRASLMMGKKTEWLSLSPINRLDEDQYPGIYFAGKKRCKQHRPKYLNFIKKLTNATPTCFSVLNTLTTWDYSFEFQRDPWAFAGSPKIENITLGGFCLEGWFLENDEKIIKDHLSHTELRKQIRKNSFKIFENADGGTCVMPVDYCREPPSWYLRTTGHMRFKIRQKLRDEGVRLDGGFTETYPISWFCGEFGIKDWGTTFSIETLEKILQLPRNVKNQIGGAYRNPELVIRQLSEEELKSLGFDDPKNRDYAVTEVEKWLKI